MFDNILFAFLCWSGAKMLKKAKALPMDGWIFKFFSDMHTNFCCDQNQHPSIVFSYKNIIWTSKNNYKIVSHQLSQIDPFWHFYLSFGCYIIKCYFRLILACIRMQQFQKYDSFLFLDTLISLGQFSPYLKMSFLFHQLISESFYI